MWGDFDNFEHPPFAKYLFGVAQLIAGHQSVVADRVVAALCTLGTALVLGLWLGKAAVAGSGSAPQRWSHCCRCRCRAAVPLRPVRVPRPRRGAVRRDGGGAVLGVVQALWRAGWWWALATGASVGLAAASKENGFLGAVGPVLAGLALAVRDRRAVLQRLLQTVTAVLTACLVFAVTYLGLGHPVEAFRSCAGSNTCTA